ncbi:MAG TPA: hypothetical protein VGO90_04805 [Chthoniobacteraceae bacterium]|jgi:hypothetical protein|nr:hypothetical protein [Chthoniobacter sp.]HEV7866976.1 hypothetical protein [Chthoniobacteraceae bacterium]
MPSLEIELTQLPEHSLSDPASAVVEGIAEGVEARGYHILEAPELEALWSGAEVGLAGKLMRLHTFATANGWKVVSRRDCGQALFQMLGQFGRVDTDRWRLTGEI